MTLKLLYVLHELPVHDTVHFLCIHLRATLSWIKSTKEVISVPNFFFRSAIEGTVFGAQVMNICHDFSGSLVTPI